MPDRQRLSPAYWRLATAHGISNLGDGVYLVAMPLLAVRLTHDPVQIALIATAAVLPWLVLSLPIGALVDRADRRRVMIVANMVRAVVLAALAVAITTDSTEIWMLWVVALILGTGEVFYDTASQALVPDLVPAPLLPKANGRLYAVEFSANTFIGAPVGSLLIAVGVALPFGVDAVSFAIAALLVMSIPGRFRHTSTTEVSGSLYAEVRTGVRWLWRSPLLRTVALSLALSNLAFQMPQAVFVLFAREELGVGERGYGVLFAVMGVGSVLGGLLGDRVVARLGAAASIYTALVTWVLTLLAVGLFPVAWFVAVAVAIESLAATVWNVVLMSLRQQAVPSHLFGRVNTASRWIAWGTLPLGSVLGGVVASAFGLRATYFVGAAIMVGALAVAMREVSTASIVRLLAENQRSDGTDATPVAARVPEDELLD